MIALMTLLIGLLGGFYGRAIYDYVKAIYTTLKERYDVDKGGIIKPTVTKATRNQPINLESQTGGIRRPSPDEVAVANMIARDKRLREL